MSDWIPLSERTKEIVGNGKGRNQLRNCVSLKQRGPSGTDENSSTTERGVRKCNQGDTKTVSWGGKHIRKSSPKEEKAFKGMRIM